MCHFITLIVPSEDTPALAAVMKRHGRGAMPVNNPSLAKALRNGERQYITSRHLCDCGTVLGQKAGPTDAETMAARQARHRRKGWSEARIARAIADSTRVEKAHAGPDSLDLWAAILGDLAKDLRLPYAALFVHGYSGGIETEDLKPARREASKSGDWRQSLGTMSEDEVTVFSF